MSNENEALRWLEMDVDAMSLQPSVLNVKVKGFNEARLNGGSNNDFWACRHVNHSKYNLKISSTTVLSSLLPELQAYV